MAGYVEWVLINRKGEEVCPRQYGWPGKLGDKVVGCDSARAVARRVSLERREDLAIKVFITQDEARYVHLRSNEMMPREPSWFTVRECHLFRLHPEEIRALTAGAASISDGIETLIDQYNPRSARAPVTPVGRKIPKQVNLAPATWDRLQEIGGGNCTNGLRRLVADAMHRAALAGIVETAEEEYHFWLRRREIDLLNAVGIEEVLKGPCDEETPLRCGATECVSLKLDHKALENLRAAGLQDPQTGLRRRLAGLLCGR